MYIYIYIYRNRVMTAFHLSNMASFVSCVFRRVKDRHDLLHCSPLLKKTCVRQVVLDKWFPPSIKSA